MSFDEDRAFLSSNISLYNRIRIGNNFSFSFICFSFATNTEHCRFFYLSFRFRCFYMYLRTELEGYFIGFSVCFYYGLFSRSRGIFVSRS